MDSIHQSIEGWFRELLVSGIMDNISNTFQSVNDQVVRGKMILPSHGKEFFTSYGKHFFTYLGKKIFTYVGKDFFTRHGKQFFPRYGKQNFTLYEMTPACDE